MSVSLERLERALVTMARIVSVPTWEHHLPVFERIERALAEARIRESSLARARAIAARSRMRS